jgi:hypothetical protein
MKKNVIDCSKGTSALVDMTPAEVSARQAEIAAAKEMPQDEQVITVKILMDYINDLERRVAALENK